MADDLVAALFFWIAVGLVVTPGFLLYLGWRDLRARNYERADTRATLSGLASVGQFMLAGLLATLISIQDGNPGPMVVIAVPAALWVLSRGLHRSIRLRREADRRR